MVICPCCGEIVTGGDPYCPNCGTIFTYGDEYDEEYEDEYEYEPLTPLDVIKTKEELCRSSLEQARNAHYDSDKIEYYKKALKRAEDYISYRKVHGLDTWITSAADFFTQLDINIISRIHCDSQIHYFLSPSYDLIRDCEEILERTGNGDIVSKNNQLVEKRKREIEIENKKSRIKKLREDYFKHLKWAQGNMEKNKFTNAFNEYKKAFDCYDSYFKQEYDLDEDHDLMPDKRLSQAIVDDLLVIYKNTHPLLTSKNRDLKVNSEIVKILDGKYDDDLSRMEGEAREIKRQRELEMEKNKAEWVDGAAVVIAGARVLGEEIFKMLKNK